MFTPESTTPQRFLNYIQGSWVEPSTGRFFPNENPADTRQLLSLHAASGISDAEAAITAAHQAFPSWRSLPAPARGRLLSNLVSLVQKNVDDLATSLCLEEGKIFKEARGEVLKGLNLLEFYAGEGFRLGGETLPSEMPRTFTYTLRQPLGVAAIITPWNFPFAIPCWKMAPALMAGNTVVFKPATATPLTAAKLMALFHEAGFPPGVVNMVTGGGSVIGDVLVTHPLVKVISFTGSNEVGRRLYELAARNLKKVTCEMGGKNPVIVLDDADLELAVEGIMTGAFGSTGQRCTATSRVVVTPGIKPALMERLEMRIRALKVGNGMDPSVHMGPAVSQAQLQTDLDAIARGQEEGARLVCGGHALTEGELAHGYYIAPTLFDGVEVQHALNGEEIFGPVLSVLEARDVGHALELANAVRYGLSSSLYSRDITAIMRYVEESEVGMVHVNSPTVGGEAQLPFGGVKETGVGDREMGHWGIEFFTELKTVFLDYTGKKRETNIY